MIPLRARKPHDLFLLVSSIVFLAVPVVRILRHGIPDYTGSVVFFYYGAPAALGCIILASLLLRPRLRVYAAITICSILVSAFLAEGYMQIVEFAWSGDQRRLERVAWAARKQGKEFDSRTRLEILGDLRRDGVAAQPPSYPSALLRHDEALDVWRSDLRLDGQEVLPFAMMSNATVIACNDNGPFPLYKTDDHGFNNPPGLWEGEKAQVVTIGDSYTAGYCVPTEKTIAANLRRFYPGTVNLGISTIGPLGGLAIMREYAPALRPRLILWFFYEGNDPTDLTRIESRTPLLLKYLDPGYSQDLMRRKDDLDRALGKWLVNQEREHLRILAAERNDRIRHHAFELFTLRRVRALVFGYFVTGANSSNTTAKIVPYDWTFDDALFKTIMGLARKDAKKIGSQIVLVFLPHKFSYCSAYFGELNDRCKRGHEGYLKVAFLGPVARVARELDIPLIDFGEFLERDPDPGRIFSFPGSHYNETGYRVLAEYVQRVLAEKHPNLARDLQVGPDEPTP